MKNTELSVIKQAIFNELEGYEFYKLAMSQVADPEVKETFHFLAQEEQKHIEWLTLLFNKLKTSDDDNFALAELENPPSPKIFDWKNLDRTEAGLAVSVFGIGIQMERASVEFYKNAKEKTPYPAAKELYATLEKWERIHLDQFSAEYDKLQENWWSDQGYAPY